MAYIRRETPASKIRGIKEKKTWGMGFRKSNENHWWGGGGGGLDEKNHWWGGGRGLHEKKSLRGGLKL